MSPLSFASMVPVTVFAIKEEQELHRSSLGDCRGQNRRCCSSPHKFRERLGFAVSIFWGTAVVLKLPVTYILSPCRKNELCLLEIKINSEPAQPLSVICHRDQAYRVGRQLCSKLKELIPRQMFRVPIQVRGRGGGSRVKEGCGEGGKWGGGGGGKGGAEEEGGGEGKMGLRRGGGARGAGGREGGSRSHAARGMEEGEH